MDRWKDRVALVTGASMGMGERTCKNLAKHGMNVVGCARTEDKLKIIEEQILTNGGQFMPIVCDLRKHDTIIDMFAKIKEKRGGVDVCINNAGLSLDAPIITGRGILGKYVAIPLGHRCGKARFYSSTKYAVTALTEGIRWELREINSHIKITSISPRLVKTNFAYTAWEKKLLLNVSSRQGLQPEDIEGVLSTPLHGR